MWTCHVFFTQSLTWEDRLGLCNNHKRLFRFESKFYCCKHTIEFWVFILFIITTTNLTKGSCLFPDGRRTRGVFFWGSVFLNWKPIKNSLWYQKALLSNISREEFLHISECDAEVWLCVILWEDLASLMWDISCWNQGCVYNALDWLKGAESRRTQAKTVKPIKWQHCIK